MPRVPTTDASNAAGPAPERAARIDACEQFPMIDAGEQEYDAVLGLFALFFVIPREEAVYFRLVVESWEDFAVVRTMQRFCDDDRTRSVVVVMAVRDQERHVGDWIRAIPPRSHSTQFS